MLSARVLLSAVLLVCGLSAVHAQTFGCGGAGYDLTAIGDLSAVVGSYTWTINPCVPITTGSCVGKNATFCQDSTVVSYYNPAVNVVEWMPITNGIMSRSINGQDSCSSQTVRTGAVQYFCNAAATTAYISNVEEVETCQYAAQVQTSLVCGAALNATSTPVGLPFSSTYCGGGLFNLSTIDSSDFIFTQGSDTYWWRPCSPLAAPNCTAGTSFCQSGYSLSAGSGLAQTYTLQTDGLIIQSQDGTLCAAITNTSYGFPREANVILQCDSSATSPVFVSFSEGSPTGNEPTNYEYCHYTAVFKTATVCTRLTTEIPLALQPTFACGGAGYDLTLISAVDMVLPEELSASWILNPCRPVSQGPCAGEGATMCQTGFTLEDGGTYGNVASYYQPIYAPIFWSALTYNGANAIQSYSIYGDQGCGVYNTRTATVIYVCDATQTSPLSKLQSVTEAPQCSYTAIVSTSLVCSGSNVTAVATTPGLSFTSTTCGGGLYNLAALDSSDFAFTDSNGGQYWWRPCSVVTTNPNCTAINATFCQSGTPSPNSLATAITLNPAAVNGYTPQSNGLLMQSQSGTLCGAIPRAASVYMVCDASASTPQLLSYSENQGTAGYLNDQEPYCHYELILATNVVCAAAAPGGSSSSSSGSVVVVSGGSSSSSASASGSAASSSSASAASAASSSSAATSTVTAVSSSSSAAAGSASSSSTAAASVVSSSSASSTAPVVVASSSATSAAVVASSSTSAPVVASSSTSAPVAAASSSTAAPVVVASSSSAVISVASSSSAAPVATAATAASSSPVVSTPSSSAGTVVTPSSSSTGQPQPTSVNGATSNSPLISAGLVLAVAVAAMMM